MTEVEIFDFVQILLNPAMDTVREKKGVEENGLPPVFYFQLCILQAQTQLP